MRKLLFWVALLFLTFRLSAQRKENSWKDYLSFANATKVAVAGTKTYCATEGGLFYYNTEDNSVSKVSRMNGLNDFGIQTIAYSSEHDVLVVAYKNSNVDLVYKNRVVNLPDIKRKQITGDKKIYNISFSGSEAFLSCGFGIVALNLGKQEVKDTYIIGDNGSFLRVNDVEVFGAFIYAATNEGILRAEKEGVNLPDYRNWQKEENIPHASEMFNHLAVHAGSLIANYTTGEMDQDVLFRLDGNGWEPYLDRIQFVYDMQVAHDYLVVADRGEFYLVDNNHAIAGVGNFYLLDGKKIASIQPRSVDISVDGTIRVADYNNGLVSISGDEFESVYPEGPMDNRVFSLHSNGKDLWIAPGGRTDSWNNTWQSPRFQLFRDDRWNYFSTKDYPGMDGVIDIVGILPHPSDPDHIFVASWGGGVLEFQQNELVNHYTNQNSPLQTALPDQPDRPYVRIGGIDFDSEGNLWVTNSEVDKNLLKLTPGGEWETVTLPEVSGNQTIGQLLVTENDDKWILVPRGNDAYVVDKTGSEKKKLPVTSYFNNGQREEYNRMNDVYCIAEDLDGAIWIGTSRGVAVYNQPQRIWDSDEFYAVQPSLDLGDGLYHPLLESETVTALAIDGANRKWIGTRNSGVYLVSERGNKEVLHFTSDNSPLLSNNITALSINQLSGEVFIGTSEGLISYMGDATGGKDAFADVFVYPNPVREDWDGPVTVTGLMEDTDVKITDISGNLVYQGTSLGGQAVWDGKNLKGNRVKTGVYLVFCNDRFGEETHIEKLLFIN